jgi:hypothetical protein
MSFWKEIQEHCLESRVALKLHLHNMVGKFRKGCTAFSPYNKVTGNRLTVVNFFEPTVTRSIGIGTFKVFYSNEIKL